ncbi:MAG: DUF502 domain-containing protein [Haloferacaceae archaeon]
MSITGRLRTSFVTGLLLVAPLAVTAFVLQFVFARVTGVLNPVVSATRLTTYTGDIEFVAQLLAAVLVALTITALGYLASWSLGQRLFGGFERGVRLVPLVRTVYFGVRQVSESLSQRSDGYERVVLVEYPRAGSYAIGFVTNDAPRPARSAVDEKLYTVFVPNSPNPTGGRLLLVPDSEMRELDMSVRRGLRLLVTTGLSTDEEELPEGVAR